MKGAGLSRRSGSLLSRGWPSDRRDDLMGRLLHRARPRERRLSPAKPAHGIVRRYRQPRVRQQRNSRLIGHHPRHVNKQLPSKIYKLRSDIDHDLEQRSPQQRRWHEPPSALSCRPPRALSPRPDSALLELGHTELGAGLQLSPAASGVRPSWRVPAASRQRGTDSPGYWGGTS